MTLVSDPSLVSRSISCAARPEISASEKAIASASTTLPGRDQLLLRPAITPPSTSQVAPVTQAAWSDSRNVMTEATSCGVPIRPIGWKLLKPCKAGVHLGRRNEAFVDGRGHHGRRHAVDADALGSEFHGQMLRERVQPGLGHGVSRRRRGLDRLLGPHGPDVHDRAGTISSDKLRREALGNEEERLVQGGVGVVVGRGVGEEWLGGKQTCSVNEQVDCTLCRSIACSTC